MLFRQIPNILSLIRILLVPVIFNNYLTATSNLDYILCGLLLVISGITDIADGAIARKFDIISNVGKILDPIADKLTQIMVMIALSIRHSWMWPLLTILIVKDLTIAVMGIYLYKKYNYVGAAKWYGKVATIVFYPVIIALISIQDELLVQRLSVMVNVVFVAMLFSGIMYGLDAMVYIYKSKKEQEQEKEAVPVTLSSDEYEIIDQQEEVG